MTPSTKYLRGLMIWLLLASCMSFATGCAGGKPIVLNDSDVPLLAYDAKGHLIPGYRAYSDGLMAELVKGCQDKLDREGVP
jgi:hypothetical protein